MQFCHLGIGGGQHFFSYSEALSATHPSAEIYEQSLSEGFRKSGLEPLQRVFGEGFGSPRAQ